MPTQTFINLEDKKKEMIIEIALEEFALHNYKSASVTKIVEKAGIAKGSMYRYFKNKKDLYLYIINLVAEKKFNYIKENLDPEEEDFFEKLKQMHLLGLQFDLNNIKCSKIIVKLLNEKDNEEVGQEVEKLLKQSEIFVEQYIIKALNKGALRQDIELDLISYIINKISLSIAGFIEKKYNFNYVEVIKEGKQSIPINEDEFAQQIDKIINILKTGLSEK